MVECFLPRCQIVLGRFEEVAKQKTKSSSSSSSSNNNNNATLADDDGVVAIEVGLEYARKELFDEVKVPDQPFGKWFRGTIIPKAADRACFLINGNRQSWHYGWQSSRLNCKNLHVFKVYFFNQSEQNPAALTCVAELASPSFRISSSRKARKTFRSPVMSPEANNSAAEGSDTGGAGKAARVPSIDELLSKTKREHVSSSERFPSQQRRSLVEPLTLLEQPPKSDGSGGSFLVQQHLHQHNQYQQHPSRMGYPTLQRHSIAVSSLHAAAAAAAVAATAENDHARRERKRLTRSASLKSDYFTNVSFPPLQQQHSQQQQQMSLSATHPPPQFAYQQQQVQMQQMQQQQRVATPTLPSVAYMNGNRMLNARRSSLAALPMPSSAPMPPVHNSRGMPVTTPIADMMQLRLESPHPQESYHHQYQQQQQQQQRASLSSLTPSALHQHAYSSAKPMSFGRRDAWSANAPPVYFPMIPASSPDGYLNRKRNRSTDSDKGLLAAIQASEALLASARGGIGGRSPVKEEEEEIGTGMGGGVDETDTVDLHRRARVLQLAFTILKRIHRFEEVSKAKSSAATTASQPQQQPKVYRHSFEMVIPFSSSSSVHGKPTLVQIPLSNHQILHLCSSLVSVSTSLMQSGLLLDIRQRLVEYAQAGVDLYSAYSQLVDFVDDAVHEQVCQLPKRTLHRTREAQNETAGGGDQGGGGEQWDLYDLLKNAEAWLLQEPWWCATDEDDDDVGGGDEGGPHSDLPYYNHFADYYESIQAAIPSHGDLEVAASLRDAALNGVRGLTGEWLRQGNHDELSAHSRPKSAAAASSASGASLSWLSRQIHGHMTQVFHMTETATTMTLALPNSLISSEAVFLFDLDRQEPTVVIPQDYFPFGWTRKRLMVAYRAWRVRGIGDENGSSVAVQFMRWPDDAAESTDDEDEDGDDEEEDDDEEDDEPEEEPLERSSRRAAAAALLRTRVTIYFSVFSHNRLQVRTIVEGSIASGAAAAAPAALSSSSSRQHPTEADMLQYFKSPSSWELMSQVTQEYERKSAIDDDL